MKFNWRKWLSYISPRPIQNGYSLGEKENTLRLDDIPSNFDKIEEGDLTEEEIQFSLENLKATTFRIREELQEVEILSVRHKDGIPYGYVLRFKGQKFRFTMDFKGFKQFFKSSVPSITEASK